MGRNQWISPKDGRWSVHGEGNSKPTKIFDKKSDALKFATEIAKNQNSAVISQKQNGQINLKNSFGNDPHPPIDKD